MTNGDYTTNFRNLLQEIKNYLSLQKEYATMDAADKLTVLLSAVALSAICFMLGVMVLFCLTFAFAHWMGNLLQSLPIGFACAALIPLITLFITYRNRNKWIIQPLARFLIRTILKQDENEQG